MKGILFFILTSVIIGCNNPFAPKLDTSPSGSGTILGDQHTIDGVFLNFKQSYAFRDTTIYGQLLAPNFIFVYRDYEKGVDVFWGRDEDIRTTHGLFQNVQRLDLIWNSIISSEIPPDSLTATIRRNFNLTVTFDANDVVRVSGYANLILERHNTSDVWLLTQWNDVSDF